MNDLTYNDVKDQIRSIVNSQQGVTFNLIEARKHWVKAKYADTYKETIKEKIKYKVSGIRARNCQYDANRKALKTAIIYGYKPNLNDFYSPWWR